MPRTYDGVKTAQSGTDGETTETTLSDGSVNDTLLTESVKKTLGDLVGTVVLSNLLTKDEDLGVGLELLSKGLVERITDSVLLDTRARALSVGSGLGGTEENRSRDSGAGSSGERNKGGTRSDGSSSRGS